MPKRYVRCQDITRSLGAGTVDYLKINKEYELVGEKNHFGEEYYVLARDERENQTNTEWYKSRFSEPYTKEEEDENKENKANHEEIL